MSGGYMIYMAIGVISSLIGMALSARLKSKFAQYGQVGLSNGLSGKEIAEKMLRENGINDVVVTSVQGHLTDHYNPANKLQVQVVQVLPEEALLLWYV